jgi:hypothetical protein
VYTSEGCDDSSEQAVLLMRKLLALQHAVKQMVTPSCMLMQLCRVRSLRELLVTIALLDRGTQTVGVYLCSEVRSAVSVFY